MIHKLVCCLMLSSTLFSMKEPIEKSSSLNYFRETEPQVFHFWDTLSENQKSKLANQLKKINLVALEKQKQLIKENLISSVESIETFNDFEFSGNVENQKKGQRLIEKGELGCLVLAGGQGTRLKYHGPKGKFPISVIKRKTLFQLCVEKVKAASLKAGRPLFLAIMTSPENDEETQSFFKDNHFFGLDSAQISFFMQDTLPFLNSNGKLFLFNNHQISTGSDGNGHCFHCFARSGIMDRWIQHGVKYLHVVLIDNPLADPFDAELLGFHLSKEAEITLKCTEKVNPKERVGLLVKQNDHCNVVEYSEISDKEKEERRPDGRLKHCCANLSLFCFSLSFIKSMTDSDIMLPLHRAWKAAKYIDNEGIVHSPSEPNAWKFETFIFDWLVHAEKVSALIYPREECFAPLKSASGADTADDVKAALQKSDRRVIQQITGLQPPEFPFELAAEFYYPTEELKLKWKGRPITEQYVEP